MNTDDMDKIKLDDMLIVDTNLMHIKEQELNAKYEEWVLREKTAIMRLEALARQIKIDAEINRSIQIEIDTINRSTNRGLFVIAIVLCFALIGACLLKTL